MISKRERKHKMTRVISGHDPELIKAMSDAGILPDNCIRIIVDICYDGAVKIYYEMYGDDRLLDIDFASHIGAIINQTSNADEVNKKEDTG